MQEEQRHLSETLALIRRERTAMELKRDELTEEVRTLKMRSGGTYDNDLVVQEFILQRVRREALGLRLAQDVPYFSRIDFIPTGEAPDTHYIGKHGVLDSSTLESVVADWRSPIANLYYSGQVGKAHYEVPDGTVDGELTLKRMFSIEDGRLLNCLDVDLMTQDKLLVDALSAVSGDRLKEVVTTIQAEQNAIIRHPMRIPLIVQGVAGSGKTTIALHRIAYLLYAHADVLSPANLMILAPNPLFLHYISSVLPDLGVENAQQTTLMRLCLSLLGKQAPTIRPGEKLDELLDDPEKAERLRFVARTKGSLEFGRHLECYLDELEKTILPKEDIKFGPISLIRAAELERVFLTDLAPFAWRRRVLELNKILKKRVKTAAAELVRLTQEATVKRADIMRATMEDGPERRERLTALYATRDARLEEIAQREKEFAKSLNSLWPPMTSLGIYRNFLATQTELPQDGTSGKYAAAEDLPPLVLIERRLGGLEGKPRVMHAVIDEAQDFSPLALQMLKAIFNCGFTLVGDMGQGIYRYRGMDSWEEALEALPDAQLLTLRTSYRSTVEIMEYANELAAKYPYPGQILAVPVLRHGNAPRQITCAAEKERIHTIAALAKEYSKQGMHSIAILGRDAAATAKLCKALDAAGLEARMLDPEADDYRGGTLVAPATAVKGLEFDAVIVADARAYPQDLTGARLLYVCATRALHELAVLA